MKNIKCKCGSETFIVHHSDQKTTKVRTYIKLLKKEGMISLRKTEGITILSVCNYNKYNSMHQDEDVNGKQLDNITHDEVITVSKEIKKDKIINKDNKVIGNVKTVPYVEINIFGTIKIVTDYLCDNCKEKLTISVFEHKLPEALTIKFYPERNYNKFKHWLIRTRGTVTYLPNSNSQNIDNISFS